MQHVGFTNTRPTSTSAVLKRPGVATHEGNGAYLRLAARG